MADQPKTEEFKFYRYEPSVAANAVFVALFGLATAGHTFVLVKRRTWYFIPFVIGGLFETIGYIGRIISAKETPTGTYTLSPYIMQTLLILLAPPLLAASIYMVLGRLIRMLQAEQYSLVRINWLTKVFVLGDVLSFLAQSAGGGILATAKSKSDQKMGDNVALAGLGIQVVFFGLFIVTTIVFHIRINKQPTSASLGAIAPWRRLIWVLYVSSAFIMIRSVFRMVEFGMGNSGILQQNEGYLFGMDGALMFLVCASLLWCHPGQIVQGYKAVEGRADVESFSTYPLADRGQQQMWKGGETTDDSSNYPERRL